MKNKRIEIRHIMLSALLCVSLALCGCDNNADAGKQDDNTDQTVSSGEKVSAEVSGELLPIGESDTVISGYPVTVNDTEIEKAPQKVICLSSSLTEIICELGHGDSLIGRGSYCDYPEEAALLDDFGKPSAPDIAAVKAAAPDVLITATSVANMDVVSLNNSGIRVVYIPAPRTLDEFGRIYNAVGMIFEGRFEGESKGSAVFSEIRNKLSSSGISLGRFIYVTEGLCIAGGDTFESSVLSLYGTNIAEEASGYSYDKSLLTEDQPDTVIFSDSISLGEITSDSVLGTLDAVSSGKVCKVPNSYFEAPSGRIVGLVGDIPEGVTE